MKVVFFDFVGMFIMKVGENVIYLNIVREVLKKVGWGDLDVEEVWRVYEEESFVFFLEFVGKEVVKIRDVDIEVMRRVVERYGFIVFKDFWEISIRMYEKYGQFFLDVVDIIKVFKGMGFYVGIIIDFDNDYIIVYLKVFGIYDFFDSIIMSEEVGFFKFYLRLFQFVLEKVGVKLEEVFYVGDNLKKDCVGVKNIGMISVFFDLNGEKRELWENCDFIVLRFLEVVGIIKGLKGQGVSNGRVFYCLFCLVKLLLFFFFLFFEFLIGCLYFLEDCYLCEYVDDVNILFYVFCFSKGECYQD